MFNFFAFKRSLTILNIEDTFSTDCYCLMVKLDFAVELTDGTQSGSSIPLFFKDAPRL